MDFKMYHLVCFILLVSLAGISCGLSSTSLAVTNASQSTGPTSSNVTGSSRSPTQTTSANPSESAKTNAITATKTTKNSGGAEKTTAKPTVTENGCLINLNDMKDWSLGLIILLLFLICLLLLIIIMCMACKCCRGTRNSNVITLKSSTSVRRNSVNGGPSETDVMLKDCSSVKVEMETIPAESEKPEEVGGADAEEVKNQDSTEENKNSANDASEAAPTQEAETDLKMEAKTEALEITE